MLKILRRELDDAGYETMYLDGDTPAQRRVEMAEQFNAGQGQIFLISLKAGGTGLNRGGTRRRKIRQPTARTALGRRARWR